MRAGRLVALLRLLQTRGRLTAVELSAALEVSQRTIFRDIDALSGAGVPVYAVRGCQGGFELLDRAGAELPGLILRSTAPADGMTRARILLSPRGRQLAAVLGRPSGLRIRPNAHAAHARAGWVEASVRIDSVNSAVHELLALGAEAVVLRPPELCALMAATARQIADLYSEPQPVGRHDSS